MSGSAVFSVFGNVMSSVGLILSNKQLVEKHDFDHMVVLTGTISHVVSVLFAGSDVCVLHYKMISNHMHLFRISMAI